MRSIQLIAATGALVLTAAPALAGGDTYELNEIYASHSGTDDFEYIEVKATPGADMTGIMLLVVEGDGTSAFGTLDRVWDLSSVGVVPPDGFVLAGDDAVPGIDFSIGATNRIENGADTFYLIHTTDVAGVTALSGTDIDTDDDLVTDVALLAGTTILDIIGIDDGDGVFFDGAAVIGPDGTFLPPGIFRACDAPNAWCSANFLDFDDVVSEVQPLSPGGPNPVSCSGGVVHLNELYLSHSGTDDREFIELIGTPDASLDGRVLLGIEGDAASSFGTLDFAVDLSGLSIGPDGFFVAGNTIVANLDLDIGASNILENGSATYYIVETCDVASLLALAGTDVDADDDQVTELGAGVKILDLVAPVDADPVSYDGAQEVGPDGTFLPGGIFRAGDYPNPWCTMDWLDFDADANSTETRTPGEANNAECGPIGIATCFGDGSGAPCPCGNDSPNAGEGCLHTGLQGMGILVSGSNSIGADDLVLTAFKCPPNNSGIFLSGDTDITGAPMGAPFDGLSCIAGDTRRYAGIQQTTGVATDTDFVLQAGGGYFVSGTTYYFQYWSRDVSAGSSPCLSGANFSPAMAVTMTP